SWVSLLIIVPIARKLADFAFPPWPEALWKLAVIALACNVVAVALDPVHFILSLVAGAVVFFTLMVKWFEIDFFGAIMIVIVSWVVRAALNVALAGAIQAVLQG
ncbi:unnamed protein product, partial [marine sediment metagenome]